MRLIKTVNGLIPYTEEDELEYHRLSIGDVVKAKTLDKRILKHHRKFFALIRVVYDNMPEQYDKHFPTSDDLRYELIKRAGFFQEYTDLKGKQQYRPDSISFDNMSQKRFEELYSRVLDVVIKWFDFDRDILENEILLFGE